MKTFVPVSYGFLVVADCTRLRILLRILLRTLLRTLLLLLSIASHTLRSCMYECVNMLKGVLYFVGRMTNGLVGECVGIWKCWCVCA